jgi:hypothetical protein
MDATIGGVKPDLSYVLSRSGVWFETRAQFAGTGPTSGGEYLSCNQQLISKYVSIFRGQLIEPSNH